MFIAAGLYIWAIIILLNQDNWIGISTITTLLLALAAFWAIMQNYSFRRKEHRERLLNEIIEWAINISNCNIGASGSDTLKAVEDPLVADQILTHYQLTEWGVRLQGLKTRGKYIGYISDSTQFSDELKTAVKKLNGSLDIFLESLYYCADIKYRGLSSEVYREQANKSFELRLKMDEHANKVIEEATTIKIKNLG